MNSAPHEHHAVRMETMSRPSHDAVEEGAGAHHVVRLRRLSPTVHRRPTLPAVVAQPR